MNAVARLLSEWIAGEDELELSRRAHDNADRPAEMHRERLTQSVDDDLFLEASLEDGVPRLDHGLHVGEPEPLADAFELHHRQAVRPADVDGAKQRDHDVAHDLADPRAD